MNNKKRVKITSEEKLRKARTVTIVGLILNGVLAVLKISISIWSGSLSLLADGFDSALDLASTLFSYFAVRIATRPADKDHPYGHEKYENFFSLGIAVLLIASSGIIGFQAVNKLIDKTVQEFEYSNVIIAASSIVLKSILVWINIKIGRNIDSSTLIANGKNFRTDIMTSSVVLISVIISPLDVNGFSLYWIDPTIALLIGIIIIITAFGIVKDSSGVLLDRSPDEKTVIEISEITSQQKGVIEIGRIRARKIGSEVYLAEIDLHLDPNLTIEEGHIIATEVEKSLKEKLPIKFIQIHIEPYKKHIDEVE